MTQPTKNTTHTTQALAKRVASMVDDPNSAAYLAIIIDQLQEVEDFFWDLFVNRTVDTAVGVVLDLIGVIVGEDRRSTDDDEYRRFVRARIAANKSDGSREAILACLPLVYDDTAQLIMTSEPIATVRARIRNVAVTDSVSTIVAEFLRDCASDGIKTSFVSNTEPDGTAFQFGSSIAQLDAGAQGDTDIDLVQAWGAFPLAGKIVIDEGLFTEEYLTYSNAPNDTPDVDLQFVNMVNELGQPGLRWDHDDNATIRYVAPKYTIDTRNAVVWENIVNATATGNDLEKTGGAPNTWDTGATSVESSNGDCAVEWSVDGSGGAGRSICGLSIGNVDESFADIDYGVYHNSTNDLTIRENGTSVYVHENTPSATDVLRVQRIGTEVTYWLNGALMYTSTVASSGELLIDCSIYTSNDQLNNVFFETITPATELVQGFVGARYKVAWENIVNCDTEGNNLTKNNASAWATAGATSIQKSGGDCVVEFTTASTSDWLRAGLGEVDVDQSRADVEYAIAINGVGVLAVYESNVIKYSHGTTFTSGDVARVQRVGTEITYWINGEKIYTSAAVDPTNNLYFDTAFFQTGSTIVNAMFYALTDDGEPEQAGGSYASCKSGD